MKKLLPVALAFLFLSFISCQSTSQDSSTSTAISKVLSVSDFEQKLKDTSSPQLVDVRTPEELAQGAISGAVNYNFYDDNFNEKIKSLDPQKPIFVYCKSGGRSGKTANLLKSQGFKEVYDLEGGYTAWKTTH